jgi:hypothetical protein
MKNQTFDFSVNVLQALLWQHNNAPHLTDLMTAKQEWYDTNHTAFWNDWVTNVFDLRTCNLFGMCVWAVILGIPLSIILDPDHTTKRVFGFSPFGRNFLRSNFATLAQIVTPLTLDEQRAVLQLRYFQLITRADVLSVNAFLKRVFAPLGGTAYMIDHLNMKITYRFTFQLSSGLRYVLSAYDLLPRPAGVSANIV